MKHRTFSKSERVLSFFQTEIQIHCYLSRYLCIVLTRQLEGTIIAPNSVEAWKWPNDNDREAWMQFSKISGLVIYGGGQIDGQGAPWWNCFSDSMCERPTVS